MLEDYFRSLDPDIALWSVRSFYIFASYAIIIVRFIPDLQYRFLDYGARSSEKRKDHTTRSSALPRWLQLQLDPLLDVATDVTVPHSWFYHFYLVSSICTAIWSGIIIRGYEPQLLSPKWSLSHPWEARTKLCMLLMQVQGLRRLYECLFMSKPSKSRMWIGHYVIGIAFYLVTNVAIWLESGMSFIQKSSGLHRSFQSEQARAYYKNSPGEPVLTIQAIPYGHSGGYR